ncbi:carboxymuconolactone decarboxylase family protein [Gordonia sp. NPDC003376]
MSEATTWELPAEGRWVVPEMARVSPLDRGQMGWAARLTLRLIRRRTDYDGDFTVFRTFARLGSIFPAHSVFLSQILLRGRISAAHKELVIVHVAWRTGCAYEWAHHAHMAGALDVTPDQIRAVSTAVPAVDDPILAQLLSAAAVLVDRGHLDEAEWTALSDATSPDRALELCLLVGHYVMVAMAITSAGIQLEPEFRSTSPEGRS